jgi:hypothetical protein
MAHFTRSRREGQDSMRIGSSAGRESPLPRNGTKRREGDRSYTPKSTARDARLQGLSLGDPLGEGQPSCVRRRRARSRLPANARQSRNMYPSCTRGGSRAHPKQATIYLLCRDFGGKPSDGLEPSTPSLPWRFVGWLRVGGGRLPTFFSCIWTASPSSFTPSLNDPETP